VARRWSEARVARVVVAATRALLRDRGREGVVLASPQGPEGRLLAGWLEDGGIPVHHPREERLTVLRSAMAGARLSQERVEEEVWRMAAVWEGDRLLPTFPVNRTALLLAPIPPGVGYLPLGDLPASEVLRLTGEVTLPDPWATLGGSRGGVEALDHLLDWWEHNGEGEPPGLPPPGDAIHLLAGLRTRLPELGFPRVVVKLGSGTVGLDLDI